MPGPPKKPTHLKLITGNPGHKPLPENEPRPAPAMPTIPSHLARTAKVEWRRVAAALTDIGLLSEIDRAMLAAYCQAYADWVEAERSVKKFGKLVKSPSGFPMQSPYLAIRNRALELLHRFAAEFGMSPASRTRIGVEPGKAKADAGKAGKYF